MGKHSKQKRPIGSTESAPITDPRFTNIQTDARFRLPSKRHSLVNVDQRFARMLHDDDFEVKAAVDKYGRKVARDTGKQRLRGFYRLEDTEEKEAGEAGDDDNEDFDGFDENEEEPEEPVRIEKKHDPARDGGFSASEDDSSSSSEEDGDGDGEEEVEADEQPEMQLQSQLDIPMGEVSSRLAVVNLDWDNINAADLMAVFSSFLPSAAKILKVSIYPSEFGKERMQREEVEGPPREIFASGKTTHGAGGEDEAAEDRAEDEEEPEPESESESESDEAIKNSLIHPDTNQEFDTLQLRQYQLSRLRYYYAILEISSPAAAKALYDATDGTEYLSSANFFDLRFVPDDVHFADESRDTCTRVPDGYRPTAFVTDALQHSKVKLTWDADDAARKEATGRAFVGRAEAGENDLRAYLGSDSSDQEGDEEKGEGEGEGDEETPQLSKREAERARMRAALGLGPLSTSKSSKKASGGPVGDMQITFTSGLSAGPAKASVFENEPVREETTVEKYVRKEKERKQKRKRGVKGEAADLGDSNANNDNVNGETHELDAEGEPGAEADLGFDDPFFTTGGEPSKAGSKTRKSKEERRARREQRAAEEAANASKRAELELLMADDNAVALDSATPADAHSLSVAKLSHFDMSEIARAEKIKSNKYKKGRKRKEREMAEAGTGEHEQQGFKMDVEDPRFAKLYDSHEFAIDPTNPRFSGTDGMKALLDAGRKKRKLISDD
ncbi:MAG: pre-rRNA-processing protein esf1 [Trizodia sp. TS-e1964]|nr:MAG: pre-rRNA-processing protein esf1 [Trizodia sp. TS-e1964]